MGSKWVIIAFIFLTVAIIGGAVVFLSSGSSSATVSASQNAKADVESFNYDWGIIDYNGGNVTKTFSIRSSGTDSLRLTNVKTSCHCTKAQIIIEGTESPSFGMNSVSSWIGEVQPGKEAQLKVIFDPKYHGPNGVGPVNRLVAIETNDAQNSRLEFSLTGNVIKE